MAVRDTGVRRWPRGVYDEGGEPDPRFTLANERTFLAWVRTSLALMAAGVGIEAVTVSANGAMEALRTVLAVALLGGGVLCSATAFTRWHAIERALRLDNPLPAPRWAPVVGYGVAAVGLVTCVVVVAV